MGAANWNAWCSGGLIFVGLEMRQSQQIALAAQQQARTSALVSIIGSFSEAVVPANWRDMVSATLDSERGNEEELGNNAAYQLGCYMKMTIFSISLV